jgi:tRNA (mo5U34)-methyltransferase
LPRSSGDPSRSELQRAVDSVWWYHTLDLGEGVRTPGLFDHRPILDRYNLPQSFAGKRVLDVAAFDGFWAFEFEKRGAREVVALDLERRAELDWNPHVLSRASAEELESRFGAGFEIAKARLRSNVRRVACSVYDLTPEKFGTFDIVHSGDFLLHLASPVRALQNMAKVCTEYALISDVYTPHLDAHGSEALLQYLGGRVDHTWWKLSRSALERMILDAGFGRVEAIADFAYGTRGAPETMRHAVFKAYK